MRVRVGSLLCTQLLSAFLEFMQQWLPGFAEVESPISVDVIWMHLSFDGFSDETIYVAGELPKRKHNTYSTRRKLKIKKELTVP